MPDSAAELVKALQGLRASIEGQNKSLETITQTLKTMHERVAFLESLALNHEKRLKKLDGGGSE